MDKNIKLLYCILGSVILCLLNSPILERAQLGLFSAGYGSSLLGVFVHKLTTILSFIGFILLIVFSITLISRNINFKK